MPLTQNQTHDFLFGEPNIWQDSHSRFQAQAQASMAHSLRSSMDIPDGQDSQHLITSSLPSFTQHLSEASIQSSGLHPTHDAREIIRLLQCPVCSRPLSNKPITFPCGNSICTDCLPPLRPRQNISYPNTPDRQLGCICPFEDCRKEHAQGDYSVDVTLQNFMDGVQEILRRMQPFGDSTKVIVEEVISDNDDREPAAHIFPGGALAATYTFAQIGELPIESECTYSSLTGQDVSYMDVAILGQIQETVKPELQCLVCFNLFLDPLTTPCGHTFCRKCLERVLDHNYMCPVCRRVQHTTTTYLQFQPSNRRLTELLVGLFPDDLAQRAALGSVEDVAGAVDEELPTPLFVCTLSFPRMPTFLHIFEPRYRLMIRRAWHGDKRFGMVLPNRERIPQGDLGNDCQFLEFGTLLEIKSYELLQDGRSWVETVGVSRFRVKNWGVRDDYVVASVETVDDLPLAREEQLEALDTSPLVQHTPQPPLWTLQSTQNLLRIGHNFVQRMQARSTPMMNERALNIYGPPPQDAATFPYWLASVLAIITDQEKYRLLSCTSVRGRLKIVVGWIRAIEDQQ